MPKMVHFGEFLKTWSLRSNSVPDRSVLIRKKLVENAKIQRFKCDILGDFQTLWKGSKIVENVPENQGTFFLGTWKGLFCRQKNNTCFACTKCNITEKNMKHPAMLARDRELQIRTRERNLHRKNGFIDFSSSQATHD